MIIAQTTMSAKKLFGGKGDLADIAERYARIGYTGVDQKCFWEIIGKLKALGAEGILVLPIEKMIL